VEYIEPSYPITLPTQPPTTPTTDDAGSGGSPSTEVVPDMVQPTSTTDGIVTPQAEGSGEISTEVVPVTTNLPTPTVESTTPTTVVTCNKMRGKISPSSNCLIMFQYDLPPPRMNELYDLLSNFDSNKIKPIFRGAVKGFYYVGLNKEAIMKVI